MTAARPLRAAVYDRFWHSQGGGERHSAMIGVVLAQDGVAVDLLGHTVVDKDELGAHLGIDLSKVDLRIVPDKGDLEMAAISQEYDLFVNGSYMSRLAPRAQRNAYLCYFPTPFDADLSPWRRAVTRRIGKYVRAQADGLTFGTGWFPPEGGRRRQWIWTSGDAILALPPGIDRTLRFELGGPGLSAPVPLQIRDEHGEVLGEWTATSDFVVHRLPFPDSLRGTELHFTSPTFTPGGTDHRTLGVAVSRMRMEGGNYGPREIIAQRFPWLLRDATDLSFLASYDTVMANSEYTRSWIRSLWGTDSEVLFPPIQTDRMHPAAEREKAIVTVGRFFSPGLGHAKRQLEMVQFFAQAHRNGALPKDWKLYVVGGCEDSQKPYLAQVRAAGAGLPVEVIANAPRTTVERLLSTSSVFWSATGYGEDERKAPWSSEHFGMTTVESMAGGCVPVVIDKAGQKEIVREGVDGFRWTTPAQLIALTARVAGDEALRARLASSAVQRAQQFGEHAFADRWHEIAAKHDLLG
ncbi:MAG: glycosyl transferase group 1 [Frankiales bacterium]|jgi:glycosyltransferase involved in cell wall biosynthesis|nr:glycosyl transferase group 1 [Frankiales bacterium]